MKYLIGLDIGTSSIKGVLMSEDGNIADKVNIGFRYSEAKKGIMEISAKNYLNSCIKAIESLVESAQGEILGICASSASGNLVLLDEQNIPITPIVNWQDKRVTNEAEDILSDIDTDKLYETIGWGFDKKTFPLAQLCYIKKHNPYMLERCSMITMSTEYLYFVLTGKWGISTSAGTPFYLIDQRTGKYDPELLQILGISEDKLPPVLEQGTVVGYTTDEISEKTKISSGIPVILGCFDHPTAARGSGVFDEGQMLLSCGTSWVCFFPVKSREIALSCGTLIDPFLTDNGTWGAMISLSSLSLDIKRYVERYIDKSDNKFDVLSRFAQKSQKGAGGLTINIKTEPNEDIMQYSKENIARAIMEGTASLLKDCLDTLKSHGIIINSAIMVGGPSESSMWIEVISDICSISVNTSHGSFTGAVGAAMLCGIGIGLYKDEQDAFDRCSAGR